MENKVAPEVTRALIEQQLALWRNTLEDNRIAMEVANAIGDDDKRKEVIRKESTRCVKAIEKLEAMLKDLDTPKEVVGEG